MSSDGKRPDREEDRPRAKAVFRPIVGSRAALEVADQLTFAVMSGLYQAGEFLPTIEELAEAMGVSRPTVGEAVHLLSEGGVVEVRRGARGGIFVLTSAVPPSLLKLSRMRHGRTLAEVVEARRPLELAIVRFAAERATAEDVERLESANALLADSADTPRGWTQANNLFHATLARSARNMYLAHMQHEQLEEIELLLDGYNRRYSEPERTLSEHEEILAAVRANDPDQAEAAMGEHLRELEDLAPSYDDQTAELRANDAISPPRRGKRASGLAKR